jgi:hypothetical protein
MNHTLLIVFFRVARAPSLSTLNRLSRRSLAQKRINHQLSSGQSLVTRRLLLL